MADDDLQQLQAWVAGVLASLEPGQRTKLMRVIARDLRQANVERIRAQTNPDGSAFAPRKRQPLRNKSGRLKRRSKAMFQKLRQPRYLNARATPEEASAGFDNPQVSRLGWVHQLGLRDNVRRRSGAAEVDYPARQLLGFAAEDPQRFMDVILKHVTPD